jgi:hypothetical protein
MTTWILSLACLLFGVIIGVRHEKKRAKTEVLIAKAADESLRAAVNALAKKHGHSDVMSWSPLLTIQRKLEYCDTLLFPHEQAKKRSV